MNLDSTGKPFSLKEVDSYYFIINSIKLINKLNKFNSFTVLKGIYLNQIDGLNLSKSITSTPTR
jgi:hypothetical protein